MGFKSATMILILLVALAYIAEAQERGKSQTEDVLFTLFFKNILFRIKIVLIDICLPLVLLCVLT